MIKSATQSIHDFSDLVIGKVVNVVTMSAVVGSVGNGLVTETFTGKLMTPEVWVLADYAAIVGIFAGLTMAVQRIVDMYLSLKKAKGSEELTIEQAEIIKALHDKLIVNK